jgi:hypothetical protein
MKYLAFFLLFLCSCSSDLGKKISESKYEFGTITKKVTYEHGSRYLREDGSLGGESHE